MRRMGSLSAAAGAASTRWAVDSFDKYPLMSAALESGWNSGDETAPPGGAYFFGQWFEEQSFVPAFYGYSFFARESLGSNMNGLSEGLYWAGSWVEEEGAAPQSYGEDSFETYSLGSSVDTLNNGSRWASAWKVE